MSKQKSDLLPACLFLLPNFVGFLIFMLGPIILSVVMAFTNWSLRPNVDIKATGIRNFVDLLGVHAIGEQGLSVLSGYIVAIVLIAAGLMGLFLSMLGSWRGVRWGGLLNCLGALLFGSVWMLKGGDHVFVILVAAYFAIGWLASRNGDRAWEPGRGLAPPLMLLGGLLLVWFLHERMWTSWELRDPRFYTYLFNTLYLMMGIPFSIAGSLMLALLLNHRFPVGGFGQRMVVGVLFIFLGFSTLGIGIMLGRPDAGLLGAVLWGVAALGVGFNVVGFRTMFYLPKFTAGVALMILWKAMYNPETGPINMVIATLGGWLGTDWEGPRWLASVLWAKPALIIMAIWFNIGGTNMLLYLAGLSNVPNDLLDAAEVDGAGRWARFRHVIWPQLAPTTFFISIMSVIGGLQGGFEQARVMTGGGPAGATTTLSFYIYNKAFQDLDMGYAAAISWILFAIIFSATAFNWRFGRDLEVD